MEQFLMIGEELINTRDIHRIKKDFNAHVECIRIVFRHLRIIHINFSTKVARNAEFNTLVKELKEGKNIVEIKGGTVEEEDFHA